MKELIVICLTLLTTAVFNAEAADAQQVHKKVQEALDWQLPGNNCLKPEAPGQRKEVRDEQGATRTEWDVDSYTIARYERKEKRWQKCVDKYKSKLADDFETLKNSAQYGLTPAQAETILTKMKLIQTVISSPEGLPPAAAGQVE